MNAGEKGDPLDPMVTELLNELDQEIPEPDWVRLRTSIVSRGRPVLASKARVARHPWIAKATPMVAAAGIALILWMVPQFGGEGVFAGAGDEATGDLVDETQVIEALGDDITEAEFRLLASGRANAEAMLAVAVSD